MKTFRFCAAAMLILGAFALVFGCTGMTRTVLEGADCPADADGHLVANRVADCGHRFVEEAQQDNFKYTLHFVEFDDQGWAYRDTGFAAKQMDDTIASLKAKLFPEQPGHAQPGHKCISHTVHDNGPGTFNLVVFVHGWKHTADYRDQNVASFRKLVRDIAIAECSNPGGGREVIGIYVGWRGTPVKWPESAPFLQVLDNLTFWDRKSTAIEVAQGQAREFLLRIDSMSDHRNELDNARTVRTLHIGHSFGGHLLLTSLGGNILKSVATVVDGPKMDKEQCEHTRLKREGDMVVLVNAAIESSRYEALYSVASRWDAACYKAPMLVAATSTADYATRYAFPAGRTLSTLLQSYTSDIERYADLHTLGHNDRYLTHELALSPRTAASPGDPLHLGVSGCGSEWSDDPAKIASTIRSERASSTEFAKQAEKAWSPETPRVFCGGTTLTPIPRPAGPWKAPILNIRVSGELIPDHNDIYDPRFVSFIRELYMDTLVPIFGIHVPDKLPTA
jgi:hypothetical protein